MELMVVRVVRVGRDVGRGRGEGFFFLFYWGSPILNGDFLSSYILYHPYIQHSNFPL